MFYERWIQGHMLRQSRNKIRLLFGARQTGKTELLKRLCDPVTSRLFNLQDSDLRRRYEADPASFTREIRALPRSVRTVAVDEIQKVPALLDEVQALYDDSKTRFQFYLTGSSARRLRTGSANLLPGRSHAYHLYPVCSLEVAGRNSVLDPSRPERGALAPPFPETRLREALLFGNLPGIRSETPASARRTLSAYVAHYLEEEIRREAMVRELGPFIVFLRLAATESGSQVNLSKLSQESGVPASTLKTYYNVLVDTFVGYWMAAYARRARTRLLTTPRFFIFDLGVRNAAAELPLESGLLNASGGDLLEHRVGLELIARAGYMGAGYRVSFWRTVSGAEADYIWESPREDIPIEVKWTERPRPADARHLEAFIDQYPKRARRGFVVCRCREAQQLTDRVQAIPWDRI